MQLVNPKTTNAEAMRLVGRSNEAQFMVDEAGDETWKAVELREWQDLMAIGLFTVSQCYVRDSSIAAGTGFDDGAARAYPCAPPTLPYAAAIASHRSSHPAAAERLHDPSFATGEGGQDRSNDHRPWKPRQWQARHRTLPRCGLHLDHRSLIHGLQ